MNKLLPFKNGLVISGVVALTYAVAGIAAVRAQPGNSFHSNAVVWALNVGGGEHFGQDGVHYLSDLADLADDKTTVNVPGRIDRILGAQDNVVYTTYRSGEVKIRQPISNGRYDITFQFAEPEDIKTGARVFDVIAEGQRVIDKLDVRLARDGRHRSALTRTVTDVEVSDGQLDIALAAITGKPIINGLVVRSKQADPRPWELVWSDEFDTDGAPDPSRWTIDLWQAGKVNSEDQAYTGRSKNVRVAGGRLVLEAQRERYEGASYTSGRIHSQGKGDFLYGRVDIRARLPAGQGTWPALWMLPSDPYRYATSCKPGEDWQGSTSCDAWPNSGEIDIMEHVGFDMNNVHGTVHNRAYYWANWEQRKGSVEARNVDKAFHVYSLEWTPQEIHILFDGSLYFSYFNDASGWQSWPYDHPYHIILNLAIGGMWGRAGGPIDDSIFPVKMEVDYVRVFKLPGALP